jgi:hypothetical protein
MTSDDDTLDEEYTERENEEKAMVLSVVKAIQHLVLSLTKDPQHLGRCDEICDAVIAFAFKGRLDPLIPDVGDSIATASGSATNCPAGAVTRASGGGAG